MDAMSFWKAAGTPVCREVCQRADVKFGYFEHIAHGRRQPSPRAALRLAEESAKLARKGMTVISLLGLQDIAPALLGKPNKSNKEQEPQS